MSGAYLLAPLTLWLMGAAAALAGRKRSTQVLYIVASLAALAVAVEAAASGSVLRYTATVDVGGVVAPIILEEGSLTAIFVAAVAFSCLVSAMMHRAYWRVEGRWSRGFALLLGLAAASIYAAVIARSFLSLLIAWEAMSFTLGALIAYGEDSYIPAMLYLVLMHITSLPLLAAAAYMVAAGCSWYTCAAGILPRDVIIAAMLIPFVAKSGLFPLYFWLPPGHSRAPSDASVVLSGASVKPALLQAIVMFELLGLPRTGAEALLAAGLIGAAVGVLGSLWSREAKRVLAYSTAAYSALAWLIIATYYGFVHAQPLIAALAALVIGHAAYKSIGFMAAGLAKALSGTDKLSEMEGLCGDEGGCLLAAAAATSLGPYPPFAKFFLEFIALYALALVGARVLPLIGAAVLMSATIGLAYVRLLSSLSAPRSRPTQLPRSLGAAGIAVSIAASVATVYFCSLPRTWAWLAALVAAAAASALLSRWAVSAAERTGPWLAGRRREPVAPGAVVLAVPAPRPSIEEIAGSVKAPYIRERGLLERLYRGAARAFDRIVLRPLIWPMRSGNLFLYVAIMLVFFVAIVIAAWWW